MSEQDERGDLIDILESFNRKEMFYLTEKVAGMYQFSLDDKFIIELCESVGLAPPTQEAKLFVGLEYHLAWVYASLLLSHPETFGSGPWPRGDGLVKPRDRQDVDLFVAYNEKSSFNLIFLEAKGYLDGRKADYSSKEESDQINSKLDRIERMFEAYGQHRNEVRPRLCLALGATPKPRSINSWPAWALEPNGRPNFIPIDLPDSRRRVQCCDDSGKPSETGHHFRSIT